MIFFDIDNKNNLPVVDTKEMKEALNMLIDMNKDRALRAEAFSREIFSLDQNSQLYEAEQKGKAEGIAQGKAEGIAQGKLKALLKEKLKALKKIRKK